jgi:subtilisin family serine protease
MADHAPLLSDKDIRDLVFETFGRGRFTQDTPFLPEVWIDYIEKELRCAQLRVEKKRCEDRVDLLLTPWLSVPTGDVAQELRARVQRVSSPNAERTAQIAPGWTHVAAKLDFPTAAKAILPMCGWWQKRPQGSRGVSGMPRRGNGEERRRFEILTGFVMSLRQIQSSDQEQLKKKIVGDVTALMAALRGPTEQGSTVTELYLVFAQRLKIEVVNADNGAPSVEVKPLVFAVNTNREALSTVFSSRATIKADAAQNLFQITTDGIAWAIVDCGIDATHPAFRNPRITNEELPPAARSRITRTYDFTNLRQLLATGTLAAKADGWPSADDVKRMNDRREVKDALATLKSQKENPRDLDWKALEPVLCVPHTDNYAKPKRDHGTHVAGILGADWPANDKDNPLGEDIVGMCRDIQIYDLRVFDNSGKSDEFTIMSALSFVGWLNRDRANPAIHGVNLSLALMHYVDSFACGRTPICDVCNELVGAGTVVVAAAGNTGFEAQAEKRSLGTGYRMISITDPGNADGVITVGAVHKSHPHAYGISYFSSRGPTGDGRLKPDLVAPGEKIDSTVPMDNGAVGRLDGTSMAAPHVSGAAALLMSRHRELVGAPRRVKEVLMKTATDLGRERHFQGAGLVDVLRALQSV